MRLTKKTELGYAMTHKSIGSQSLLDIHQEKMEIKTIVDKLGQLEDVEEELGIDLITFFKIYNSKRIYMKRPKYNTISEYRICHFCKHGLKVCIGKNIYVSFKDYGKTWALTKEELEK